MKAKTIPVFLIRLIVRIGLLFLLACPACVSLDTLDYDPDTGRVSVAATPKSASAQAWLKKLARLKLEAAQNGNGNGKEPVALPEGE